MTHDTTKPGLRAFAVREARKAASNAPYDTFFGALDAEVDMISNLVTGIVTGIETGIEAGIEANLADSGDLLDPWKHGRSGTTTLLGYTLVEGCGACPEDYDLFLGEERVAYLRLRYGKFRIEVAHLPGTYFNVGNPKGDGVFDNDDEREAFLLWGALLVDALRRERGEAIPARSEAEEFELCALRARLRNTLADHLVANHEAAIRLS